MKDIYIIYIELNGKTSEDFITEVLGRIMNLYLNRKFHNFCYKSCLCSNNRKLGINFYDEKDNYLGSFLYFIEDINSYPFDIVRSYYLYSDKVNIIKVSIIPYISCIDN